METKSIFKTVTRRSSISEREKRGKKSNKKRKKGKRGSLGESEKPASCPNEVAEVAEGECDSGRGKEVVDLSHENTDMQQHVKVSPRLSPSGVSQSGGLPLTESPSINTDLSESTISLISSHGNSQTDILEQTPCSSNVIILTESQSVSNVKSKTPAAQTGRSQSVAVKPQQRSVVSTRVGKTSTFNKSKSSNAFLQSSKACAKLKTLKDNSQVKMDVVEDQICEKSEALRWELSLEDLEQEEERIKLYKINRRKRYLAAARAKGLAWAREYNECGNPDMVDADESKEITVQQSASSFISVQSLVPTTVQTVKGKIFVDC